MHAFKHFSIVAAIGLVQACEGGGESLAQTSQTPAGQNATIVMPQESQLRFVINYVITPSSPVSPNGGILVSPITGQLKIGTKEIARVELLLFGSYRQELTRTNSEPKAPAQQRYFFKAPETFVPGVYPCGTGRYLSEVRVTDVTGFTLSKTFELCPGVAFETSASAP